MGNSKKKKTTGRPPERSNSKTVLEKKATNLESTRKNFFLKIKDFIYGRKGTIAIIVGFLGFISLIFTLKEQIFDTFSTTKQESQTDELIAIGKKPYETSLKGDFFLLKEVIDNITLQIPLLEGEDEVKKYDYKKGQVFLKFVKEKLSSQLANSYLLEDDSLLLKWQNIDESVNAVLNLSFKKYSPSKGFSCDTCFDDTDRELGKAIYMRMYENCIIGLFDFLRTSHYILENEKRFLK